MKKIFEKIIRRLSGWAWRRERHIAGVYDSGLIERGVKTSTVWLVWWANLEKRYWPTEYLQRETTWLSSAWSSKEGAEDELGRMKAQAQKNSTHPELVEHWIQEIKCLTKVEE